MQFLILALVLFAQGDEFDDGYRPTAQNTAEIRFAVDELDRVAIVHNRDFRPKYLECQTLLNEYFDEVLEQSAEYTRTLDQLQLLSKLRTCSKELKKTNDLMRDKLNDFKDAVGDIPQ